MHIAEHIKHHAGEAVAQQIAHTVGKNTVKKVTALHMHIINLIRAAHVIKTKVVVTPTVQE